MEWEVNHARIRDLGRLLDMHPADVAAELGRLSFTYPGIDDEYKVRIMLQTRKISTKEDEDENSCETE